MTPQAEITQEALDTILKQAIEDLRESGVGDGDIFLIVKEHFGTQNAQRFCCEEVGAREEDSNRLQQA